MKSVQRCTALATLLTEQNFPAIGIHRGMTQEERLTRYQSFKDFQTVIIDYFFAKIYYLKRLLKDFLFNHISFSHREYW